VSSKKNHKAFVGSNLVHWHDEAVAEHDFRVDLDTVTQNSYIELLPLVRIMFLVLDLVGEAAHHAALQAAPGPHLGVPAD